MHQYIHPGIPEPNRAPLRNTLGDAQIERVFDLGRAIWPNLPLRLSGDGCRLSFRQGSRWLAIREGSFDRLVVKLELILAASKRPTLPGVVRGRVRNKPPFYRWTESKLRPCPFCGGHRIDVLPQPGESYLVRCQNCPAQMLIYTRHQGQLVASWNNRRSIQGART